MNPEIKVDDNQVLVIAEPDRELIKKSGLVEKFYDCSFDVFMNEITGSKYFLNYTVMVTNPNNMEEVVDSAAYVVCEICYGFEAYLWINLMYVKPEYRGNGFPAMIIKGLVDGLHLFGIKKIKANIGERSKKWWEKVSGGYNIEVSKVVTYHHKE